MGPAFWVWSPLVVPAVVAVASVADPCVIVIVNWSLAPARVTFFWTVNVPGKLHPARSLGFVDPVPAWFTVLTTVPSLGLMVTSVAMGGVPDRVYCAKSSPFDPKAMPLKKPPGGVVTVVSGV
jgi:hypothetical protein